MASDRPAAFLSYTHFSDQHDANRISDFRARLADEVKMLTGEDFDIFQDRKDIAWGENWRERIIEGLDGATFFIPIVTPGYFTSSACREELQLFLKHERKLRRKDLVLPIYYVETLELRDTKRQEHDKLAATIAKRQYADWRNLRHDSWTTPAVGREFEKLALRIRNAVQPDWVSRLAQAKAAPGTTKPPLKLKDRKQITALARETKPAVEVAPPLLIVDPYPGRGDHTTIAAAIDAALPGTRILVRPGHYSEPLVVKKPLEIQGDGPREDIVVRVPSATALTFEATMGRIAGLTFRQDDQVCIEITQGRLQLEECDLMSKNELCLNVTGRSDPRIRRNLIHGSNIALTLFGDCTATIEDNDLDRVSLALALFDRTSPNIRHNRIRDCGTGMIMGDKSSAVFEDNDISGSAENAISIIGESRVDMRRNRICNNKSFGIAVSSLEGGLFEENDLRDNSKGAWIITPGCEAKVRRTGNIES